jgi:hypothetical protein
VIQGTLQEAHHLRGGIHTVAAPSGYLFEHAFLFEGVHQPARSLEGDAEDLRQIADVGHGTGEEVVHGREQVGPGTLPLQAFSIGFAQFEEPACPAGGVAGLCRYAPEKVEQPLLPGTLLTDGKQVVVVGAAVALEVGAQVQ